MAVGMRLDARRLPLLGAIVGVGSVVISLLLYLRLDHQRNKSHADRGLPLMSELGMQSPERYILSSGGVSAAFFGMISILRVGGNRLPKRRDELDEFFDALKVREIATWTGACAIAGLAIASILDANSFDTLHSIAAKLFYLAGLPWVIATTLLARRGRFTSFRLKCALCISILIAFLGFPAFVLFRVGPTKMRDIQKRQDFRADARLLVGDARPAFEYVLGLLFAAFLATLSCDLSDDTELTIDSSSWLRRSIFLIRK